MTAGAETGEITLSEAAERLGVHYMTAYRYVRTGRLPAHKAGNQWRVAVTDVAELADAAEPGTDATTNGPRRRVDHAQRLVPRLVAGDEAGAWTLLESAMAGGLTPGEIHRSVIAPALTAVGDAWESGELTVDEEHVASNVALRLIGRQGPRFARRGRRRGTVVVGAPPGDRHGIPTALVADLLRERGYDVVDLGADVPASSFAHAVDGVDRLVAVGLCATTSGNAAGIAAAIEAVAQATDRPVLLGGAGLADLDDDGLAALGPHQRTRDVDEVLDAVDELARS